ncbi:MAG: hypothetical protein WCL24_13490, partial [Verrucomicrobiota bacterium]
ARLLGGTRQDGREIGGGRAAKYGRQRIEFVAKLQTVIDENKPTGVKTLQGIAEGLTRHEIPTHTDSAKVKVSHPSLHEPTVGLVFSIGSCWDATLPQASPPQSM